MNNEVANNEQRKKREGWAGSPRGAGRAHQGGRTGAARGKKFCCDRMRNFQRGWLAGRKSAAHLRSQVRAFPAQIEIYSSPPCADSSPSLWTYLITRLKMSRLGLPWRVGFMQTPSYQSTVT